MTRHITHIWVAGSEVTGYDVIAFTDDDKYFLVTDAEYAAELRAQFNV